ncbi:MAG: NADH-quinone oxidoreductase subunit J [candidate division Zixibacteria bacterium]|nr:NADH-quinone oxidoreductase subunit J [candidate division Zixibacteria bacterium]
MDPITLAFLALAFLIIVASLFVVSSRNIFHSAIFLILALFGVAGIFVLLEAPFLAAAQVLIYVGAISILMIFAVMLTARIADGQLRYTNEQVPTGLLVSLGLLVVMLYSLWQTPIPTSAAAPVSGAGRKLGELFLTQYVLPFEIISVLLLTALIGALVIAKKDPRAASAADDSAADVPARERERAVV